MKVTQIRFEGFLKTPTLWVSTNIHELKQFSIEQKPIVFDLDIDNKQRLGKYVERFVSHQLANTEGISLIAENIQISKDKITLGELDCILIKNKKPIHLEIVYKFYLYDSSVGNESLHHWIGPNRKDSLIEKLDKLQQKQLPLLYSKECKEYLQSIDLNAKDIQQHVYFKAQLFVPFGMKKEIQLSINTDCIVGYYFKPHELVQFKDAKFYIPSKKDWLMIPHTNVDWMSYEKYLEESKNYLERQFSPMCWMKTTTGELKKFFLIWWET